MKIKVTPLTSFEHDGTRRRGVPFYTDKDTADLLIKKGLCGMEGLDPKKKDETGPVKSPSLQAARASQNRTQKKLKSGAAKKKTD